MKEEIFKILKKICYKEISVDNNLIVEGIIDSFLILELICELEEVYNITFEPEEIADLNNFSYVENISELIIKKIENKRI